MFDKVGDIGDYHYNRAQFRAAQSKQQKHYIIYEYEYIYGNLHTYVHHILHHNNAFVTYLSSNIGK